MKMRLKLLKLGIWILHGTIFIPFIPIVALRYVGACADWIWEITIDKIADKNWEYYRKKQTEYANKY